MDLKDFQPFETFGALAGLEYQKHFENNAWIFRGNPNSNRGQTAPEQRLLDFTNRKISDSLPDCSYQPGIKSVNMNDVMGNFLGTTLLNGFKSFAGKMRGYLTNDAVIVGVESRTSTPVRIPRDKETLNHPQLKHLYPCGEGAGYPGEIMSAAMDGERCALAAFNN